MRETERTSPDAIFSLKDVAIGFDGKAGRREVLRALNLEVAKGDALGIVGPSGSGKSVLLKILAGLLSPDRGNVRFEGRELKSLSRESLSHFRHSVGMTFQHGGLFDSLTCGENLHFPLRELASYSPSERESRVNQALGDVGLPGQEALKIFEMSGGMQKRLGIARALVLSPSVVLYDDPTAGLDPITARAIVTLIGRMREKYEMTIVMVTSDPVQAYPVCNKIGFLHDGKMAQIGNTADVRKSENPVVRQFLHGLLEGPLTSVREESP